MLALSHSKTWSFTITTSREIITIKASGDDQPCLTSRRVKLALYRTGILYSRYVNHTTLIRWCSWSGMCDKHTWSSTENLYKEKINKKRGVGIWKFTAMFSHSSFNSTITQNSWVYFPPFPSLIVAIAFYR